MLFGTVHNALSTVLPYTTYNLSCFSTQIRRTQHIISHAFQPRYATHAHFFPYETHDLLCHSSQIWRFADGSLFAVQNT